MDKQKAERFARYLVSKYGEDGAKKKIQKILKTGKVDLEDLKGFAESEQKSENLKKDQNKTPKNLHGAKLDYVKTLKHQCADDEELVYYKTGGKVDCGCKKKGGEMKPEKECGGGVVSKFRKARKAESGWLTRLADATGSQGGFRRAQQEKKKPTNNLQKEGWRGNDYIVRKKNIEERRKQLASNKTEEETTPPRINKGLHKNSKGGSVEKFKLARCGSKMKKHKLGGSLNGIPFYLGGTPKGGIKEKSDNTRVQRIPNNGEGVYEQIPVNGWNFIPVVGTLKEAKMLDQGDPNASVTRFGISLAGDLAGAGMIGSVAKAAEKVGRIQKALKARGYQLFTKDGSLWFRLPKKIIRGYGDKLYTYEIPNIYGGSSFKTIPTVDYAPAVMAPLVLTLRVPAEAPFFNYSK